MPKNSTSKAGPPGASKHVLTGKDAALLEAYLKAQGCDTRSSRLSFLFQATSHLVFGSSAAELHALISTPAGRLSLRKLKTAVDFILKLKC
tara:strand:+ start:152334 stop:152606 length:273 start_codon:yes stop_codon:yes gene_type:complete